MTFMPGLKIKYEGLCSMTNMYMLTISGLSSSNPELCKRLFHSSERVILSWYRKLKEAANDYELTDFYKIDSFIGRGKFSNVYQCHHIHTGEQATVKIIDKKTLNTLELDFLRDELRTLESIEHEHIIKCLDIIETETHAYIVTELVSNCDLSIFLNEFKISHDQAVKITQQAF